MWGTKHTLGKTFGPNSFTFVKRLSTLTGLFPGVLLSYLTSAHSWCLVSCAFNKVTVQNINPAFLRIRLLAHCALFDKQIYKHNTNILIFCGIEVMLVHRRTVLLPLSARSLVGCGSVATRKCEGLSGPGFVATAAGLATNTSSQESDKERTVYFYTSSQTCEEAMWRGMGGGGGGGERKERGRG